ncbi:phosphoribosyl-ATP pyrophosphatase [Tanticharoenia sakaeratensis NBRC 103193]|uniref:Phosphoribosyl-ATP pyrophosphatase n=1 Tax=Tanticharoenia sakaeratensis NBRC 103193 TaxID=1231623 RepID=A0A0D6MI61_9PROT|nr:phosphoribosyl-ATP diphosphatase [Tanticharoenia sakaeratensis]GAN53196.1 phosphoribosyl-ATP pyrophosphatase [Tanticharoenia sakaeratensis NBRC 103193]GBQ24001.1 phosphoribosyl ATP pyrophosphatase [Tanticharoenia sakaeratensis NBRC 103193]
MPKAAKQDTGAQAAPSKKTSPKKAVGKAALKSPQKKAAGKKAAPKKTSALPALKELRTAPSRETGADVLDRLFDVVTSRRGADPALSHSARLLARGRRKIAQKFGEEAVECLIEAVAGNARELIGESADVLYHLVVMWVDVGIRPDDVWAELARREGTSGVAEKAARPHDPLA